MLTNSMTENQNSWYMLVDSCDVSKKFKSSINTRDATLEDLPRRYSSLQAKKKPAI